jgi:hypothetical protein
MKDLQESGKSIIARCQEGGCGGKNARADTPPPCSTKELQVLRNVLSLVFLEKADDSRINFSATSRR